MKLKRTLAMLLAAVMLLAMAAPALADDIVIEVEGGVEEVVDLGGLDLSQLGDGEGEYIPENQGAGAEVALDAGEETEQTEQTEQTGDVTEEAASPEATQAEGLDLSQEQPQDEPQTEEETVDTPEMTGADPTTAEELQTAINDATEGTETTITLGANITSTSTITIPSNKKIILDLAGFDITCDANAYAFRVENQGILTLQGTGKITHATGKTSGGVYVNRGAVFNMTGGEITGNTVGDSDGGGGVNVYGGTFNMTGGKITDNQAGRGGGVYVLYDNGAFNMSGDAEISGNRATLYYGGGGGVYVNGGSISISGNARISGNSAVGYGGGVYSEYGSGFTVSDNAEISGNSAASYDGYYGYGGGVYVNGGTFNMTGGRVSGNGKDADGNVVSRYGGGIYLYYCNAAMSGDVQISDNHTSYSGGGMYINNSAFTMGKGVVVSNNSAEVYGGGMYIYYDSKVTMEDGTISGNKSTSYGGGVYAYDCNFDMKKGAIKDNTALEGGGVSVGAYASFIMGDGAEISDNIAKQTGGGVIVYGTFAMTGHAKVSGNTAAFYGGGVCVASGSTFNVSGGPVVSDNTGNDDDSNVYLNENAKITVVQALDGASIGVETGFDPGVDFTAGYKAVQGDTEPGSFFTSDDYQYSVLWNGEKTEAILAEKVKAYADDVYVEYDGEAHGVELVFIKPETGVTVQYSTDDGKTWTDKAPEYTEPDDYEVCVKFSAEGYADKISYAWITINKVDIPTPVVALEGWAYGEKANEPKLITENPGGGAVSFTYAAALEGPYSETVPTDPGVWYVRATVAETNHYYRDYSVPVAFTIAKADPELKVSVDDVTYGEKPAPVVTGYKGDGEVKLLYASAVVGNASRTYAAVAWSETVPTLAGDYLVKATATETKNYRAGESQPAKFAINRIKVTVKAQDASKNEGEADPELKYTAEGLLSGDSLTGALARETGETAGKYTITQGTLDAGANYEIAFTAAALTIVGKAAPEPQPEPEPEPEPEKRDAGAMVATVTACGKDGLKIAWTKVAEAKGYDVYLSKCGEPMKKVGSTDKRYVKVSDLEKQTLYRVEVLAWTREQGRKIYLSTSPTAYAYTSDGNKKTTNPKSVSVKTSKVSLKVGKKSTIKATVKGVKSGKKVLDKGGKVRYLSSDPSVAKVNSKGKITAVSKGTCVIYVFASNGVYKTVTVKVK